MRAETVVKIIDISSERFPETVELIGAAFAQDPLLNYIFEDTPSTVEAIKAQYHHLCIWFGVHGWPLWGVVAGERLAGVAFVLPPYYGREENPPEAVAAYERFRAGLSPQAISRLDQYAAITENGPAQPHFYLMTIGVHPDYQGRGYARLLLDKLHALSEAHPTSRGVGLDLEKPANLSLYRHFGYEVIAQNRLAVMDQWIMFRPNGAQDSLKGEK